MDTSSYLEDLFSSEVMRWRYTKALTISFLLQSIITTILCSALRVIVIEATWNPIIWTYYFFYGIIKPLWLLNVATPAICYIILTRIHVHSYTVFWWVPEKRLQYFTQALHPKRLLYSVLLIFISCSMLRHFASLVQPDFTALTMPCGDKARNERCMNHQSLLITFIGLVFGFRLTVKYFMSNYRAIKFSSADPNHFVLLKSKLKIRSFIEACSLFDVGIGFVVFVLTAYLFLGGMMDNWLSPILGTEVIKEEHPFLSLFSVIMNFRFLLTVALSLTLLAFHLHCFFLTFSEVVTKPIEIPISCDEILKSPNDPATQSKNSWKLPHALVSSCDLLKLLAFHQLRDLAIDETQWGRHYRTQLFTISQPGGHPHNWQSVVNPSLNLIRKFTDRLKRHNCVEEKATQVQSPLLAQLRPKTDINKNQLLKQSTFNLREKVCEILQGVKQLPLFCYLLSELPDSKNRQIFANAQPVIWAVAGLSNIVAASYSDDQYGVVQRNIGDIITAFIHLQQMVDKVGRGLPSRRINMGTNFGTRVQKYPHDLQLRRALRLTVRSALYIITSTFKDTIRDLALAADVRHKLESYLNFQEG